MLRKNALCCAALAGLLLGTGCFGAFETSRQLYSFNKNVSPDRWGRWLAFLGLNLIVAYPVAVTFDTLIVNSMEFWTGRNPLRTADAGQTFRAPGGAVATVTPVGEDSWTVVVVDPQSGDHRELQMVREESGVAIYDSSGNLIGHGIEQDVEIAPVPEPAPEP